MNITEKNSVNMKLLHFLRGRRGSLVLLALVGVTIVSRTLEELHAQCVPVPTALVSWWQAQDNGTDRVGTNNGLLYNGLSFAIGEVGHAFNFTAAGQEMSAPASASLDVGAGSGFTLE